MVRGSPKQRIARATLRRPHPRATRLDEVILRLRHVHSAVIVAVAALRQQNCEIDEDIASLLQHCVCERLDEQLEQLEAARRGSATPARRPIPL